MKMIDITVKLNMHEAYLHILNQIEKKCKYIEYVLIDDEDTEFVDLFESTIIGTSYKNKWLGTTSSQKSKIYKMKPTSAIFKYLRKFETFCKCKNTDYGLVAEETDFGINDIAFLDENALPILYTTTHEGFIIVRNDIEGI